MWNPINFFRKGKREEEINRIVADLKKYRSERAEVLTDDARYIKERVKNIPKTPGVVAKFGKEKVVQPVWKRKEGISAAGIAYGTVATAAPFMAPAYAPQEARNEIFHIAERVAAQKYREAGDKDEVPKAADVMSAISQELEKQFKKKQYKEEWFTGEEARSIVARGIMSARDKVRYYERPYGGRIPGEAVRKLEQVGAVTSGVAQKTPGLGGMLFGKVPRQPAERMKELDPQTRSAINKGRLMLQKQSRDEVTRELNEIKNKAIASLNRKKKELEDLNKLVNDVRNRVMKEEAKKGTPEAEAEKEGEGGSPLGG